MYKHKPTRQPRQDITTLPTYTIPEAAQFLAINGRKLLSWYEGDDPILEASGKWGAIHLLSYRDLEEAYRVHLLRAKYNFSLQFLRQSMWYARKTFRTKHPLQRADAIQKCLNDLVYNKPARGDNPRTITSIGKKPGQQFVEEVANLFSERIVAGKTMYPWRFAATDHESKPVSLNPQIMSGRLVISGTRIPVKMLWGLRHSGTKIEDIAKDYELSLNTVQKALTHFVIRKKAA